MSRISIGKNPQAREMLLGLTEGVFSHVVDFTLWFTIFSAELSVPLDAYGKFGRAQFAADRFLEHVNYDGIKDAIKHARRRGWLTASKRRHAIPEITKEGRKRLRRLIPRYDEKRVWDGRMHLVTYDIPERRYSDRQLLRMYLKKIGCGRLQDSVWITPYNPVDIIRAFVEKHDLAGTVIVSDMGDGGAIGEEDLRALIIRIYNLERLNDRYEHWLREYNIKSSVDHWAVVQYLSILADDPQLPFSLLPAWWQGTKAYERVKFWLAKVYL